jgi:hypothetical protein
MTANHDRRIARLEEHIGRSDTEALVGQFGPEIAHVLQYAAAHERQQLLDYINAEIGRRDAAGIEQ